MSKNTGRAVCVTWHSPGGWLIPVVMLGWLGANVTAGSYSQLDPYPMFAAGITMVAIAAACAVVAAMRRTRLIIAPEQIERRAGMRRLTRELAIEAATIEDLDVERVARNRSSKYQVVANLSTGGRAVLAEFQFRASANILRELVETRLATMRYDTARQETRLT